MAAKTATRIAAAATAFGNNTFLPSLFIHPPSLPPPTFAHEKKISLAPDSN